MTLGEKIYTQRRKKGFSQEILAEKCGTSLRTIQRIENNQSTPRLYTLKAIADNLSIELKELEQNGDSELLMNDNFLTKINLINSSALLGVLFPFLNLIAPVIFWKLNNENPMVNDKGKAIISFQILWSLLSLFTLIIVHYLHFKITGEFINAGISLEFITYLFLLIINVFFIVQNSLQLKKGSTEIYTSFPKVF